MSLIQTIANNPGAFIERVKEHFDASEGDVAELYFNQDDCFEVDGETAYFRLAYREGGGEGEGEYVERVLGVKVGSEEIFLRTTGFYESYNGTEWSCEWVQVFPQEVTVVRYAPAGETATV